MGDFLDLLNNRFINLLSSVAMDIDPEGGNSVKIPSPIYIFDIGTLTFLNDQGREVRVILHLGKGMPDQGFIDLFQTLSHEFV
jgi:hypothetical protein